MGKIRKYCSPLFLLAGWLPLLAIAEENASQALPAVGGPSVATLIFNLALVLCVIGAFAWLVSRGQRHLGGTSDDLKIVTSKALGNRERIVVVQVGQQQLLLGVTATAVNHLHTLATPLEVSGLTQSVTSGFANQLRNVIRQNNKRDDQ
ncbi:MAG: flagellar biosynthetic protein FliO [Woeseiaceae bacterium]